MSDPSQYNRLSDQLFMLNWKYSGAVICGALSWALLRSGCYLSLLISLPFLIYNIYQALPVRKIKGNYYI